MQVSRLFLENGMEAVYLATVQGVDVFLGGLELLLGVSQRCFSSIQFPDRSIRRRVGCHRFLYDAVELSGRNACAPPLGDGQRSGQHLV